MQLSGGTCYHTVLWKKQILWIKKATRQIEEKVQQGLSNTQIVMQYFSKDMFKPRAAGGWKGLSKEVTPYACLF